MVEVARRNCVPQVKEKGLLTGAAKGALSARRSEIRLNVLGEFSLWVNGSRVSNADLAKRGARAILEYLALQSGHLSCRSRMASCIWPDVTDGKKALQRVYSCTSAIRSAIAAYGFTEDPFVSVKTSQVISLAPGVVTCDVDEFTMWAKHAVESTGDSRTCSAAMKAEELYAGDLCRLPEAPMMCLEDVREDLRRTYADAMVAGGEAAMRLDKKRLASRFANNALLVDDMREDAMTLLIRSLRASGRGVVPILREAAEGGYRRGAVEAHEAGAARAGRRDGGSRVGGRARGGGLANGCFAIQAAGPTKRRSNE